MGIQGLLPLLKECQRAAHIKEYEGQTLGIDAYVWLHRGAYGCAEEIATGSTTVKYIKYAMHRVRLLKHYGIAPYVVFDGGLLPSKLGTENDREGRREDALKRAKALVAEGKHSQAREFFVKAVDVTPQMAYQLIKALKAEGVPYIVAPYEADAQLAYLERKGIIDGIITEDSDLLVFGCRQVLFKMDSEGACVEIKRENFTMCRDFPFHGWTDAEFRQMAILSGCDYLESIQGLGIKTAHRLMRKYKTAEKVIRFVKLEGQLKVPRDYEREFKRAEYTFIHQRVFCPEQQVLVHLQPLPPHMTSEASISESLRFVGPNLSPEIARGIALGDLCPLTKASMVDIAPELQPGPGPASASAAVAAASSLSSITRYLIPNEAKGPAIKPKKRQALDEAKSNLFSHKIDTSVALPVRSRFFGSARTEESASGQTSRAGDANHKEVVRVQTSSVSPRSARQPGQASPCNGATSTTDSKIVKKEETVGTASGVWQRGIVTFGDDTMEEQGSTALDDDRETSNGLLTGEIIGRCQTPQMKIDRILFRSVSPRDPLSETGFSHISSPLNAARGSPCSTRIKREADDSGYQEDENDCIDAPMLSSPGFSFTGLSQSKRIKREHAPPSSSSSNPIDLTDLPSPRSSSPKRSRVSLEIQAMRSPSRKGKGRAIELQSRRKASKGGRVRPCSTPDSIASTSPEQASRPSQVQSTQRRDVKAPSKAYNRAKGKYLAPHCEPEGELPGDDQEDMDRRIKSVMDSWRKKFSSTPSMITGKSRQSTPLSASIVSNAPRVSAQALCPPPTPPSSKNQTGRKCQHNLVTGLESSHNGSVDTQVDSLAVCSKKSQGLLSSRTYTVLQSFRFQPSSSISPTDSGASSSPI